MAEFTPSKKTASDFNNGIEYINENEAQGVEGDGLDADTINNLVESALYSQDVAKSAKELVESVVTDAYAPPLVGMHHIQFSGEPTPAEIWAGTTWEIDTDYQGRTIIGSGGDYTFGATGGEATHTLTVAEMPNHNHDGIFSPYKQFSSYVSGEGNQYVAPSGLNEGGALDILHTGYIGNSQAHNNMPPYIVVNYWKRTA